MQDSFNKWFFSKDRFQCEQKNIESELKLESGKPQLKKDKPQKYVNRRVMRAHR
jgi:hypothetical protein